MSMILNVNGADPCSHSHTLSSTLGHHSLLPLPHPNFGPILPIAGQLTGLALSSAYSLRFGILD